MARVPPNTNDPNGYYAEIGLPPWASHSEIRRRVRALKARYHPDGVSPDPQAFLRISEIAGVLLSPDRRHRYDTLPRGQAWVDSRLKPLVDDGVAVPVMAEESPAASLPAEPYFDWLSVSVCHSDHRRAQEWYFALVAVAPLFGYTKSIRVLLHDDGPKWLDSGSIMMIPRDWDPNQANAFGLFAVHVSSRKSGTNKLKEVIK